MKWQHTQQMPHPPQEVVDQLCDPEFLRKMYDSMGHTDFSILEDSSSGDARTVKTRRTMAAEVPGALKKFLGETSVVTQTDQWDAPAGDTRTGVITVEISGAPVKVVARLRVAPAGSGSTIAVDGEAKSSIPLIGGKLADFVGGQAQRTMAEQLAFGESYQA